MLQHSQRGLRIIQRLRTNRHVFCPRPPCWNANGLRWLVFRVSNQYEFCLINFARFLYDSFEISNGFCVEMWRMNAYRSLNRRILLCVEAQRLLLLFVGLLLRVSSIDWYEHSPKSNRSWWTQVILQWYPSCFYWFMLHPWRQYKVYFKTIINKVWEFLYFHSNITQLKKKLQMLSEQWSSLVRHLENFTSNRRRQSPVDSSHGHVGISNLPFGHRTAFGVVHDRDCPILGWWGSHDARHLASIVNP